MVLKYKTIYLFLIISFYVFIYFGGQSFFSATSGYDTESIKKIETDEITFGASYEIMSLIYNYIPIQILDFVSIAIGLLFIKYVFIDAKKNINLIILSLLVLVPCILTISTFQKDLILVLFVIPIVYVIRSNKSNYFKLFFIACVYTLYAFIFRNYYFLILFLFLLIYFLKQSNVYGRILIFILLLSVILLIPNYVYSELQSSRDLVNSNRIGFDVKGNRTAFTNPFQPNSFFNFMYNYIYAILRLNFGFLFNFGFKDLLFFVYPLMYFYFIFKSMIIKSINKEFFSGSLILAHALVYFLFEPDTGSYARHLSSTLPYLAIIISSFYNRSTNA